MPVPSSQICLRPLVDGGHRGLSQAEDEHEVASRNRDFGESFTLLATKQGNCCRVESVLSIVYEPLGRVSTLIISSFIG